MKLIKLTFTSLIIIALIACSLQSNGLKHSSANHSAMSKQSSIELITDAMPERHIRVPISAHSTLFTPQKEGSAYKYLIGTLEENGQLRLLSQSIKLTSISMQEAHAPVPIVISPEQIGQLAIVYGHLAGELYQAQIVAIFKSSPTELLYELLGKSSQSLEKYVQKTD